MSFEKVTSPAGAPDCAVGDADSTSATPTTGMSAAIFMTHPP